MCEWYGGDECADVYRETTRKARKSHACDVCSTAIILGDRYTYLSGIYDGAPFDGKACLTCTMARDAFDERHDGSPGLSPELLDALDECVADDGPTSWAVPFVAAMRARRNAAKAVTP